MTWIGCDWLCVELKYYALYGWLVSVMRGSGERRDLAACGAIPHWLPLETK